jgi:hypothetical protein
MGVVVAASLVVGVCIIAIVRKKFCAKYGNKSFLMNIGFVGVVFDVLNTSIVMMAETWTLYGTDKAA